MSLATVHQLPTKPNRGAPRVNAWRWNEHEDAALESLPPEIERLYLRGIRKHMDYASGITGVKRRVSMDGFMELLNYYPPAGSKEKPRLYSRQQITRMIDKLEAAGLVVRLHRGKGVKAAMEFKLPLACNDADQQRAESEQAGASKEKPRGCQLQEVSSEQGASKDERATSGTPLTPNPHSLSGGREHNIFAQAAQSGDDGLPASERPRQFSMPIDWVPNPEMFTAQCLRAGLPMDTRYAPHQLAKFTAHFADQSHRRYGESAWIAKLVDWIRNDLRRAKADEQKTQGNTYANRSATDAKRAEQDRIAAMLSNPNDTSWIEGLFDEESGDLGAGQPGVHSTGGDLPQDVENGIFDAGHGEAGEAGSGYIDGEVVNAAHDQEPGRGTGADQGRGWRVAAERGEADFEHEAETGGFWNA